MNERAVRNWIQKAEHDLKIGKDEMAMENPATDMVCFHMQQCVEKYLKAFLIWHGNPYPRTHRLAVLIALCASIDPDFARLMAWGVDELTPYATSLRYGEEFYMPSVEETIRAIELAENVRHFVREKLAEGGMVL